MLEILAVLALAFAAFAQNIILCEIKAPPASVKPAGLENVGINQRLEQQIPLDLTFRDETGKTLFSSAITLAKNRSSLTSFITAAPCFARSCSLDLRAL